MELNLEAIVILTPGPPGVGKTTLANQIGEGNSNLKIVGYDGVRETFMFPDTPHDEYTSRIGFEEQIRRIIIPFFVLADGMPRNEKEGNVQFYIDKTLANWWETFYPLLAVYYPLHLLRNGNSTQNLRELGKEILRNSRIEFDRERVDQNIRYVERLSREQYWNMLLSMDVPLTGLRVNPRVRIIVYDLFPWGNYGEDLVPRLVERCNKREDHYKDVNWEEVVKRRLERNYDLQKLLEEFERNFMELGIETEIIQPRSYPICSRRGEEDLRNNYDKAREFIMNQLNLVLNSEREY